MGNIVLLDDLTINKIAAGEVIERPASVVKELIENSIDAGAKNIVVEIKNGGISMIRISDDGCGIAEDDMEIAFERHATSKIRSADDLMKVTSMGFRGEALASIASIANVEMISKRECDKLGHKIVVEGGRLIDFFGAARQTGTTITVQNLFYNTPVRYKFLKKDYTEAGYIEDVITRQALVNTNISFKLISNGKTVIQTNGNGDIKSVVYSIYGKDVAYEINVVDYDYEGVKVTGVVGKPAIARANRGNQLFFLNGRYIKDKNLTAAADQAYKGMIPVGRYGFLVLNMQMDPQLVDVNVHPAKLEVRFLDESLAFKSIYHAIRTSLTSSELVKNVERTEPVTTSSDDELEKIRQENENKKKGLSGLFSKILKEPEETEEELNNNHLEEVFKYRQALKNNMNESMSNINVDSTNKKAQEFINKYKNKGNNTSFDNKVSLNETSSININNSVNNDINNIVKEDDSNEYEGTKISSLSQDTQLQDLQEKINAVLSKNNAINQIPVVTPSDSTESIEVVTDEMIENNTDNTINTVINTNNEEEQKIINSDEISKDVILDNTKISSETKEIEVSQVNDLIKQATSVMESIKLPEDNKETQVININETISFGNGTETIDTDEVNKKLEEVKDENYNIVSSDTQITDNVNSDNLSVAEEPAYKEEINKINELLNEDNFAKLAEELINSKSSFDNTQSIDSSKVREGLNTEFEANPEFDEMYKKTFGTDTENVRKEKEKEQLEEEKINASKDFAYAGETENMSVFTDNDDTAVAPVKYNFIGIVFDTYVVIEMKDEMYIIDQHAAHERILYEKVRENYYSDADKDEQILLLPDIVTLTNKEMTIARENVDMFARAGFSYEEFGENTMKLISVPGMLEDMNTKQLFMDILDEIDTVAVTARQEKEDKFIATIACKAAVKGNMKLTEMEVHELIDTLLELPNPFTCPHGRPTAIKMTKYDLDRKFSRR